MKQLVVIITLLWSSLLFAEQRILRVGVFSVPPHVFPGSTPSGASVDYLKNFAKKYNYKIIWVTEVPFPRLLSLLKEGSVQLAPMLSKTKKRQKFLLYPDVSQYESEPNIIMSRSSSLKEIKTKEQLKGFRLGYIQQAVLPKIVRESKKDIRFTYMGGDDWITKGIELISKGWLDGVLSLDYYTAKFKIKEAGMSQRLKAISLPNLGERDLTYTAISRRYKFSNQLKKDLDEWARSSPYSTYTKQYLE